MQCFRKVLINAEKHSHSELLAFEMQSLSKEVENDGVIEKIVVYEKIPLKVKAGKADIPTPENYELREMLRQGFTPNAVNVSGLLDNMDSLATENVQLMEKVTEKFEESNNNNENKE